MHPEAAHPNGQNNSMEGLPAPKVKVVPEPAADLSLIKQDRPVELFRSYDQGMMDGLLKNNNEYFERFIDAYHFREFKNKAIYQLRGQIKELQDKKAAAEEKLETLRVEKHAKEAERKGYSLDIECVDKVIAYWKEQIVEAKAQKAVIDQVKTDYPLFAGVIFFAFACLFIVADYTICLSIVADTLKIGFDNEGNPGVSSHLFALAMSGLAVVLKPAYDRLIEKPYHHGEQKKRFAWMIILLVLLVLGMLFALGVFREDVISAGMMEDVVMNTDIGEEGTAAPSDPASSGLQHEWAKKFGIVSSTVLFAVAGAVCLGISLPILHKNFRKHWNLGVARRRSKLEHKLLKAKANLEKARFTAECKLEELKEKIHDLESLIQVEGEVAEKRQMIAIYQHGEMVKDIAKSTSLYLAGYERGHKLIGRVPQEWLFDSVYNADATIDKAAPTVLNATKVTKEAGVVGKRTRPFVALRRMITHNFKKKWDKENDINIEYYNFDN